jgi:hypothetical protein
VRVGFFEKNVRRLHVAMNNPGFMRTGQRLGESFGDCERGIDPPAIRRK